MSTKIVYHFEVLEARKHSEVAPFIQAIADKDTCAIKGIFVDISKKTNGYNTAVLYTTEESTEKSTEDKSS